MIFKKDKQEPYYKLYELLNDAILSRIKETKSEIVEYKDMDDFTYKLLLEEGYSFKSREDAKYYEDEIVDNVVICIVSGITNDKVFPYVVVPFMEMHYLFIFIDYFDGVNTKRTITTMLPDGYSVEVTTSNSDYIDTLYNIGTIYGAMLYGDSNKFPGQQRHITNNSILLSHRILNNVLPLTKQDSTAKIPEQVLSDDGTFILALLGVGVTE